MSVKTKNILLPILAIIPFFGFGHVRGMTNWFYAYVTYTIIYFMYGYAIKKYNLNILRYHFIFIAPLLAYPIFLYTEDKEYYYPGLAPTIFLAGIFGYCTGLLFKSYRFSALVILIGILSLELFSYNKLLPQYFYSKMNNNVNLSKLNGIKPELIFQDLDGNTIPKKYFENKVVVLDFWFTGCEACILKHPDYERVYNYFSNDPNVIIATVVDGQYNSRETVRSFLSKHSYRFPTFYDPQGGFSRKYKLSTDGYPVEIRLDRKGKVIGTVWTFGSYKDLWYSDLISAVKHLLNH